MKRLILLLTILLTVALLVWGLFRFGKVRAVSLSSTTVPVTTVRRGDVTFTATARGELRGTNSETLSAPMIGGQDMAITDLRGAGELVEKGDVVVQFDTTEQEYNLREAESDLAESEQKLAQAKAERAAKEEEDRYQLLQAQSDVQLAELEVRRNPLIAKITAQQNILALESARERLRQLTSDLAARRATSDAGVVIQEAAREKARVKAEIARRNIDSMTLRAASSGYVYIHRNSSGSMYFRGMELAALQIGDTVRAGMKVAEIPDLASWEATAQFGELDQGHLLPGQKAEIRVVAVPGRVHTGKVKYVGGTTGPVWNRQFDCKVTVDDPSPQLRPGMTVKVTVTTEVIRNAVWIPTQALFSNGGRNFVYLREGGGFIPKDVSLLRRSESQAVLSGVREGQAVALAAPEGQTGPVSRGGPLEALEAK